MDLIKYIRTEFRTKFKRPQLEKEQLDFLSGLIPFGILMQEQTYLKCRGRKKTYNGIYASIIMADLILRSDWGRQLPADKWSNLGLLKKDDPPQLRKKHKKHEGETYREYETWWDFAIDMTDHYVFSGLYDEVILGRNSDEQMEALRKFYDLHKTKLHGKLEEVIADYGLIEFDSFYRQ